jgi:hypothetical protein
MLEQLNLKQILLNHHRLLQLLLNVIHLRRRLQREPFHHRHRLQLLSSHKI